MREEFWLHLPEGKTKLVFHPRHPSEVVVFTTKGRAETIKLGYALHKLAAKIVTRGEGMEIE